jgi:rhodanese-related sulfurtransferase
MSDPERMSERAREGPDARAHQNRRRGRGNARGQPGDRLPRRARDRALRHWSPAPRTPLALGHLECEIAGLVPRRDTRVIVTDGGEGLSAVAARCLARLGYENVSLLAGGAPAWAGAGLPCSPKSRCPPRDSAISWRTTPAPPSSRPASSNVSESSAVDEAAFLRDIAGHLGTSAPMALLEATDRRSASTRVTT